MGKVRLDPLEIVSFRCDCGHVFKAEPVSVRDADDRPWHPFVYLGSCPVCRNDDVQQDGRERGWLKANFYASGPVTVEGLAISASNIAGHPTSEESKTTRFNAMKHGAYARTAMFFPARPGKYPHCSQCQYRGNECVEPEKAAHGHTNPDACLKRAELFIRHAVAFEAQDPKLLLSLRSDTQAAVQGLINDMILLIAQDGAAIKTPEWYYDKDGVFHLAEIRSKEGGEPEQIYKIEEHPLLKRLIEYIHKNNLTLADMGMTPKVQDEQDLIRGHLQVEEKNSEKEGEYLKRIEAQNTQLLELINNSRTIAPPAKSGRVIEAQRSRDG